MDRVGLLSSAFWRFISDEATSMASIIWPLAERVPSQRTQPSPAEARFLADLDVQPLRPARLDCAGTNPTDALPPSVDSDAEVAVVLGSFNRRTLLERAIDSVRENVDGRRAEIIIIDGGSADGSIDWLVNQRDLITVVQHNRYEHNGQARRRMSWGRFMNIGFRAASAGNIVMISDDCYLLPGAIPNALERMQEAEAAGLKVGACAFYFRNWPIDERYYVQRTLGGNLMVNHGIYTRKALEAVGYANERDFAFYKADSDLSLAIWREGFAIIDAPGAVCEHFMSPDEGVRIVNNQTLDFDRRQLHKRWPQLVSRAGTQKMGKRFLDWRDDQRRAEIVFGDQLPTPAELSLAVRTRGALQNS